MKRLLLALSSVAMLASGADLAAVHSVYLMPMSQGLDQYLANQLTRDHVFQVVTDPKMADAIFTDRIGEGFEEKLKDLRANPEPAPAKPANDKGGNPDAESEQSKSEGEASGAAASAASAAPPNLGVNSSFGRGKGTVFLVDRQSHQVLWSIYQLPKNSTSRQLNRTASDIVSRLKRDLKTR